MVLFFKMLELVMDRYTTKKYALIWGLIFFVLSVVFLNFDGGFFKFLYWSSVVMTVLSFLAFFKS